MMKTRKRKMTWLIGTKVDRAHGSSEENCETTEFDDG